LDNARIVILGGRGSIPVSGASYVRYGGNTTSFAIVAGQQAVAFIDAGTGLAAHRTLGLELSPAVDIFLSHYHWDHIQGLTMLDELWKGACDVRIWAQGDSRAILTRAISPPLFPVSIAEDAALRFEQMGDPVVLEGIRISAFAVNHPQGALGFRIDGPHRSVGIVTDHESGSPVDAEIREALVGVDVVIHDSQYLPEEMETHVGWGHSTFEDAIRLADAVGASELLLTSLDPSRTDEAVDSMLVRARRIRPATDAVHQGLEIPL
jgi:ribonuclease BN (tRNA processing enzyme)